jgi:HEAT repeat protein
VRYAAVRALGIKGNHKAVAALLGLLRDSDASLLMLAAGALEAIELPDAVPELMQMLKKERRDRVRGRMLRALAKCHPESAEVQKLCLEALRRPTKQILESGLIAVFHLPPSPAIRKAVEPHTKANSENTRALAIWVLGRQRDPALTPLLERLAAEEKSPDVAELVRSALRFHRGENVDGYETLFRRFFVDEDYQ